MVSLLAGIVGGLIGCCLAGSSSQKTVKHIHHYHNNEDRPKAPVNRLPYTDVVINEMPEDLSAEEKLQHLVCKYTHQPFTQSTLYALWEDLVVLVNMHPELEFPVTCEATPSIRAEFYEDKCWVYSPYKDEPEMYER